MLIRADVVVVKLQAKSYNTRRLSRKQCRSCKGLSHLKNMKSYDSSRPYEGGRLGLEFFVKIRALLFVL